MQVNDFHLTYCTNIHPGETWEVVWHNLRTYLPALKQKLSPERPFGIGLRLADIASRELLLDNQLAQFKQWLDQQNLYVFTLNGFPYGSFHHQTIKDKVYAPDWSSDDRLAYTHRLVTILSELLPDGMTGSISTVPISYKPWWNNSEDYHSVSIQAAWQLTQLATELARLYDRTGKWIHLGLEPEPDGLIENSEEVINWFDRYLIPTASSTLSKESLLRYIQVCYDTCHFAVEFEDPIEALKRFAAVGIGISKVQLSSALKILVPENQRDRSAIFQYLEPFAESTYLHQVIAKKQDGSLQRYRDLEQALPDWLTTNALEWRTHFHVPLFIPDYPPISSTQSDIQKVLQYLLTQTICHHLEIETYTWEVLPAEMKLDLATSIEREYLWVIPQLS
jgi:sugar phosphate isomerase/epimerase